MIELTTADMFLLIWAVVATAFAVRFYEQTTLRGKLMRVLIDNKESREKFFEEIDAFEKSLKKHSES